MDINQQKKFRREANKKKMIGCEFVIVEKTHVTIKLKHNKC